MPHGGHATRGNAARAGRSDPVMRREARLPRGVHAPARSRVLRSIPQRHLEYPSRAPAGLSRHERAAQAFEHGVKLAGVTVHFVTPDLDARPIVMQASVPVLDADGRPEGGTRNLSAGNPAHSGRRLDRGRPARSHSGLPHRERSPRPHGRVQLNPEVARRSGTTCAASATMTSIAAARLNVTGSVGVDAAGEALSRPASATTAIRKPTTTPMATSRNPRRSTGT